MNTNNISSINCVICLETYTNVKKNCASAIKCYTCADGFVCNHCIPSIDPSGSIFLDYPDEVADAIKCPCCRTLNWNYHYNQIIGITMDYDLDDNWDENDEDETLPPAIKLFLRNKRYL